MELTNHPPALNGSLLAYRPWTGQLGGPWRAAWATARIGLWALARRKLFWLLYAFSLLTFFSFFFGQYLLVWAGSQIDEDSVRVPLVQRLKPKELVAMLADNLKLNGSGETFRNLYWYEGSILVVTLALAGAQIVGNDFRFRSLPFYLSKPMGARHYVAGKCAAAGVVVSSMTLLPALCLFVEYGLLTEWDYFWDKGHLLAGIVGYGLLLSAVLSLILVAVATIVQRTVPLIMVWSALFVFLPAVGLGLANWQENPNWRLIDLWNDAYVVGNRMLGITLRDQPSPASALGVLVAVCVVCVIWLRWRLRAVEVA